MYLRDCIIVNAPPNCQSLSHRLFFNWTQDLRNPEVALSSKSSKVLQPGSSVVTSLSEGSRRKQPNRLISMSTSKFASRNSPWRDVRN